MGYTKLFSEIITSSIWREPNSVRIVWITVLATSDQHGEVMASLPGLAHIAGVTLDECKEAIECLTSPDEYSRTQDFEGRRLEAIDGGWVILNHAKYREKQSLEEKRRSDSQRQRRHRERQAAYRDLCDMSDKSRHTEADTNTEVNAFAPIAPPPKKRNKRKNLSDARAPQFAMFWEAFALKRDRSKAELAFAAAMDRLETAGMTPDAAAEKLRCAAAQTADYHATAQNAPQRKYAQGWLNDERYEDDLTQPTTPDTFEALGL